MQRLDTFAWNKESIDIVDVIVVNLNFYRTVRHESFGRIVVHEDYLVRVSTVSPEELQCTENRCL